jgi:multidrug efflux pump subunit AcrB
MWSGGILGRRNGRFDQAGITAQDAMLEAANSRFHAVLMTAFTLSAE